MAEYSVTVKYVKDEDEDEDYINENPLKQITVTYNFNVKNNKNRNKWVNELERAFKAISHKFINDGFREEGKE